MKITDHGNFDERLDRATAARLARLRTLPVDTSHLDARLRGLLPPPPGAARQARIRFLSRPLRTAVAALFVLGLVLAALVSYSGGPAMASVDGLARVHEQMAAGEHSAAKVTSIEAAAAMLTQQWSKVPSLHGMPDDHVMACCVHEVGRAKMACVAMEIDGVAVTMAIADRADVRSPEGTTVVRNGVSYRVQSSNGVNMAMAESGGRWVCLMGRLPVDRLIELIQQLRF